MINIIATTWDFNYMASESEKGISNNFKWNIDG